MSNSHLEKQIRVSERVHNISTDFLFKPDYNELIHRIHSVKLQKKNLLGGIDYEREIQSSF